MVIPNDTSFRIIVLLTAIPGAISGEGLCWRPGVCYIEFFSWTFYGPASVVILERALIFSLVSDLPEIVACFLVAYLMVFNS